MLAIQRNVHSDPIHPLGKPYFFIKNSRLDLKSCSGKVDLLSGCVLFRDLSDARNRYSSIATYAKSTAEADAPQTPVDCITDPDNEFCEKAGICVGVSPTPNTQGGCASQSGCEDLQAFIKTHTSAACSTGP